MGPAISRIISVFRPEQRGRVLLLGLDGAGKTTILYKLRLGEIVTTVPTIGFNVETVKYRNIEFTMWDVGGQEKIRPLWRHYYDGTNCLIFVVDCNDRERIPEAKEELQYLMAADELRDASVLVLANKQDLPHAVSVEEVEKGLGLSQVRHRRWMVQACCAPTGEGLYEGMDWVAQNFNQ